MLASVRSITVGDSAPDVVLSTIHGEPRSIASLWSERTTLFFFLRHIGCGVCKAYMANLARHNGAFVAAKAQIVMVLPLDERASMQFTRAHRLPYLVLSDAGRQAYRAFGLLSPTDALSPAFKQQLRHEYGDALPTPPASPNQGALYGVDQAGVVRYAFTSTFVDPYPPVDAALAALRA